MRFATQRRARDTSVRGQLAVGGKPISTSPRIFLSGQDLWISNASATTDEIVLDTGGGGEVQINGLITGASGGSASMGNTLVADPTTTTTPSFTIAAGTLMTTPTEGALEADADALYFTTDAGNRGYIPVRHLIRLDGSRTFTSNTNPQVIFTSPANGRITVETGTYLFQGLLSFGAMSATSGNLQLLMLGGGTATAANWLWHVWGMDSATATAGAVGGSHVISASSPASAVTAAIATSLILCFKGTMEITAAGTIQPQIDMVTASATTLSAGSYIMFERIGSTSLVSIGQWD